MSSNQINHLEAGGVAEVVMTTQDLSTVDIDSHRREVLTDLISTVISMFTNYMRKKESTKLLIKMEAQIIGAIRPIAKGIDNNHFSFYIYIYSSSDTDFRKLAYSEPFLEPYSGIVSLNSYSNSVDSTTHLHYIFTF